MVESISHEYNMLRLVNAHLNVSIDLFINIL